MPFAVRDGLGDHPQIGERGGLELLRLVDGYHYSAVAFAGTCAGRAERSSQRLGRAGLCALGWVCGGGEPPSDLQHHGVDLDADLALQAAQVAASPAAACGLGQRAANRRLSATSRQAQARLRKVRKCQSIQRRAAFRRCVSRAAG